jgi:hypothetical protein
MTETSNLRLLPMHGTGKTGDSAHRVTRSGRMTCAIKSTRLTLWLGHSVTAELVRMTRIVSVTALVFCSLSGCAGGDPALRKNPNFQEGYEDGCAAATDQGADLRDRTVGDKQLLKSDKAYKAGYSSGLQTCRRTTNGTEALPGTNPPLAPEPGGGH